MASTELDMAGFCLEGYMASGTWGALYARETRLCRELSSLLPDRPKRAKGHPLQSSKCAYQPGVWGDTWPGPGSAGKPPHGWEQVGLVLQENVQMEQSIWAGDNCSVTKNKFWSLSLFPGTKLKHLELALFC